MRAIDRRHNVVLWEDEVREAAQGRGDMEGGPGLKPDLLSHGRHTSSGHGWAGEPYALGANDVASDVRVDRITLGVDGCVLDVGWVHLNSCELVNPSALEGIPPCG